MRAKSGKPTEGFKTFLTIVASVVVFILILMLLCIPRNTPMQLSTKETSKNNKCHLFATCLVDKWEPICLFTKCVIDGRENE